MAKLRDSLSKLREHLDSLQKKKGLFCDDNENTCDVTRHDSRNQYLATAEPDDDEDYPVHFSQAGNDDSNNNEDQDAHSNAEDTEGETSPNESDATSNSASQRGTNDR